MDEYKPKKRKIESKDLYAKEVEKRMETAESDEIVGSKVKELFEAKALTKEEMVKTYMLNRQQINFILYNQVAVGLVGNVFLYRKSVKFARKVLRLEGFWPIHLACFIPICLFNFTVLGVGEGIMRTRIVRNKLDKINSS